jgi:HD superfamily phosphohydrolase YqeK
MVSKNNDKIFVGIDNEVVELTGVDKDAFIADKIETKAFFDNMKTEQATQLELKKSAYTKLGLTEEEINAIL